MIRLLIRIGLSLLGNALGLWVASLVLDDMSVSGTAFVVAVLIFTVLTASDPAAHHEDGDAERPGAPGQRRARHDVHRLADHRTGFRRALRSPEVSTWIFATVIVWFFTMLAAWLLPMFFLKEVRDDRK